MPERGLLVIAIMIDTVNRKPIVPAQNSTPANIDAIITSPTELTPIPIILSVRGGTPSIADKVASEMKSTIPNKGSQSMPLSGHLIVGIMTMNIGEAKDRKANPVIRLSMSILCSAAARLSTPLPRVTYFGSPAGFQAIMSASSKVTAAAVAKRWFLWVIMLLAHSGAEPSHTGDVTKTADSKKMITNAIMNPTTCSMLAGFRVIGAC